MSENIDLGLVGTDQLVRELRSRCLNMVLLLQPNKVSEHACISYTKGNSLVWLGMVEFFKHERLNSSSPEEPLDSTDDIF